jgi:hypothetical protein
MSTIIGNIITILGVIIGFVWIGIGMEIGKEAYTILLKERTSKILNKIKEARARRLIQKLAKINAETKKEPETKQQNDDS